MRALLSGIIVAMLAFACFPAAAAAEEELFDTKAAAAHMEKGVHLLKAKKIDAAIQEFEEAVAAAPEAEAYYLLGYAYYVKSKTGDEDALQKSIENFDMTYQINPNFSPSKFKPAEPITVPGGKPSAESAPAAAAPASTPSAAAPAAPGQPQSPPAPDQPKP
jgi:tetratricopeptide (TPR) repeat protein